MFNFSTTVYIQDILDECTVSTTPSVAPWQKKMSSVACTDSPLQATTPRVGATTSSSSSSSPHATGSSAPSDSADDSAPGSPWKSLILLVPLRLGTEKLNPIYNDCLKAMLSLDNCIGIIGGRPKHSLFFIGYQGGNGFLDFGVVLVGFKGLLGLFQRTN